jgi:hypothetical protein
MKVFIKINDNTVRKLDPYKIIPINKNVFSMIPSKITSLGLDWTILAIYNRYHANIQYEKTKSKRIP